jgi:hypothetical protein
MDRYERLTLLLTYLNDNDDKEYNFDIIYDKLLSEFNTENAYNSNMKENLYLNHLRQTLDDQAAQYIKCKEQRTKANCATEFEAFIRNFRNDVKEGLRLHGNPATDKTYDNLED